MSVARKPGVIPLAVLAACATGSVRAQDYPHKAVRLIAPFSPGGATDVLARIVGQKMSERLGQPVIIENRVGAGGNIGAELVAKSAPDGHTLLMGGVPHAISASLYAKLGYDMVKDLSAVAEVASFPSVIVLHPSLPAKSVRELITLGAEPSAKSPDQFAQYVREEIVKWAKVVRESGAKLD